MLKLTVKVGQTVEMPGVGSITLEEKSGRCIRLNFNLNKEQTITLLPMKGAATEISISADTL